MDPITFTLIELVETAYDFRVPDSEWLSRVLTVGLPMLDQGLGVAGAIYTQPPDGDEVTLHRLHVAAGHEDCVLRLVRVAAMCSVTTQWATASPPICMTLSKAISGTDLCVAESSMRHCNCAKDALGLWAVDPNGEGVVIIAPLRDRTTLTDRMARRWQTIGAHLAAGFHLRRALSRVESSASSGVDSSVDECAAIRALREAAVMVDRARGEMHESDPNSELKTWENIIEGRYSMVDCFDSGARRFTLAIRNRPGVSDPHGLTRREREVLRYAVIGESGKLIGSRLGVSRCRVSAVLHNAMRKLRVHTQAELVGKMRGFVRPQRADT